MELAAALGAAKSGSLIVAAITSVFTIGYDRQVSLAPQLFGDCGKSIVGVDENSPQ